ncbi:MAG: Fimbrial protein precursor [Firmicutes bacterium ADurb.Bin419]|nr:MAG: Fimbrial protein precursor [Firmicutes bacterium ADurb.Bin419]
MKKKSFTLIELLVVMAVIGILAAMLMPALNGVKTKGKITRARAEMNAMLTAIKQYEADYGVLPWKAGDDDVIMGGGPIKDASSPSLSTENKNYDILLSLLTKVDHPTISDALATKGNTRNIRYLDTPSRYSSKYQSGATDRYGIGFRDPFEVRYVIMLDMNYDGKINGTNVSNVSGVNLGNPVELETGKKGVDFNNDGKIDLNDIFQGSVAIYSYGVNGTNDQGTNSSSKDDIASWR